MKKSAKIFIIEDDATIVQLLRQHLAQTYDVYSVNNFRAVAQEVLEVQPDLILMDITLPYFNGFYWTTAIRQQSTVPIIFISSSDDEMDAVMAMDMGGDDFINKPFSLPILDAKLATFLRRAQQFTPSQLTVDQFSLTSEGLFSNGADHLQLTPTETRILTLLFQQQGQIVNKTALLDKLWEGEAFIDANTLNVNMTRLRKKLSPLGFDRIHTVRGAGYLLS